MERLNGFDHVAPVYDALASFAFAGAIKRSQLSQLKNLPRSGEIVILGGGTGWIAEEILKISEVKILYIDASSRMIDIAKTKLRPWQNRVQFVHGTESILPDEPRFVAAIANFYLDLFDETELAVVLRKVRGSLKDDGRLIVTDFVVNRWWHRLLTAWMYSFFRLAARLRSRKLPPWCSAIQQHGFVVENDEHFFGRFIRAATFVNAGHHAV